MNRNLHDGRSDGLQPLQSIRLDSIDSFADLVRAMGDSAFAGRQLGNALETLTAMHRDSDCRTILTITGAMTVAKQGQIVCDLIERGVVHAIIATGALIAHGLTESIGLTHYRHDPGQSDEDLFSKGYNRIYDTLEMEANLNDVEVLVRYVLQHVTPPDQTWCSYRLCRALGERLSELREGPGILRSAYEHGVPVFIPALTDSELGLDVSTWAMRQFMETQDEPVTLEEALQAVPQFNPFLDLQEYTRFICQTQSLGILTIGGGVPRNWAQQVSPYLDLIQDRLRIATVPKRFKYGVRICPEPVHWGGLSGCTYSEGVSWGKFMSPHDGGRFAEVYADATAVLPLLIKALFEDLDRAAKDDNDTAETGDRSMEHDVEDSGLS